MTLPQEFPRENFTGHEHVPKKNVHNGQYVRGYKNKGQSSNTLMLDGEFTSVDLRRLADWMES